jgi:hypothetical protein
MKGKLLFVFALSLSFAQVAVADDLTFIGRRNLLDVDPKRALELCARAATKDFALVWFHVDEGLVEFVDPQTHVRHNVTVSADRAGQGIIVIDQASGLKKATPAGGTRSSVEKFFGFLEQVKQWEVEGVTSGGDALQPTPVIASRRYRNIDILELSETLWKLAHNRFVRVRQEPELRRISFFSSSYSVRHSVSVSVSDEGGIEIIDEATASNEGLVLLNPKRVQQSVEEFFTLMDAWVRRSVASKVQGFERLRAKLVGLNVRAKKVLPLWVKSNGELCFPHGKIAKPGELMTITGVMLCSSYPAQWTATRDPCDANADETASILTILLNGAIPREIRPASVPSQSSPQSSEFNEADGRSLLWWLGCAAGGNLACGFAQEAAQEAEQIRTRQELERVRAEMSAPSRQAQPGPEPGPELVIWLSGEQKETEETIRKNLSQYIEFVE